MGEETTSEQCEAPALVEAINKYTMTRKVVVMIDAGHGDGSPNLGASVVTASSPKVVQDYSRSERDLVLKISLAMRDKVAAKGHTVHMIREDSTGMRNSRRNAIANELEVNYYVSIHADGSTNNAETGSHAIYRQVPGDDAHTALLRELTVDIMSQYTVVALVDKHPHLDDRGLAVLSPTGNHAPFRVLVEVGFASNPTEWDLLDAQADTVAQQLADGLEVNIAKNYLNGCRLAR